MTDAQSGRGKSKAKKSQIIEFLLSPKSIHFTRQEIAKQFGVTPVWVSMVASELGITRRYKQNPANTLHADHGIATKSLPNVLISPPPLGSESLSSITSETEVEAIAHSSTLSTDQQRQSLSWLALNASRDEAKVAAHRALQTLDANLGLQTRLGPGAPLTDADKIYRLSLLMQAVGKELTDASLLKAFPAPEPERASKNSSNSNAPTPS